MDKSACVGLWCVLVCCNPYNLVSRVSCVSSEDFNLAGTHRPYGHLLLVTGEGVHGILKVNIHIDTLKVVVKVIGGLK